MKTKLFFLACIIAALSFTASTIRDNFDLKIKVVPHTISPITNQGGMNKAAEVIINRLICFFNVPQESIKLDVAENQIMITVRDIDTSKVRQVKDVIISNNTLEFWETYENSEIIGYLTKADNLLRDTRTPNSNHKEGKKPDPGLTEKSTVRSTTLDSREHFSEKNPLFSILRPRLTAAGEPLPSCMIGLADGKDTSIVNTYLKMGKIKTLFPDDLKFYWDSNPYKYDASEVLYGLHAIKVTTADRRAPLDGSAILSAEATAGSDNNDVKIRLSMDPEGAKTWAKLTRENISRCIAVVYNGNVRAYPRVQSEITGGATEITGDFTIEEANDLVNTLKSGQLPFDLKIVESQIIKRE